MTLDEHYICQRAANAIISEIGPFRVSTDALQAINQFLDEFIVLLLTCSLSLDLSQIKSIVVSLLPSTLGKNAIVEAELEVKTFTETESIDHELYERMRNLGANEEKFPLDEAVPLLREKCFEYCTLADKDDQLYLQNSIRKNKARYEKEQKVIISPIVAIYVTTVMEHIAEYLLTAVAMTAEHEETDYVRVKEVFLALIDDIQLGDVFNRMDLRDKMEKRAGLAPIRARSSYLPSPSPSPMMQQNRKSYSLDHSQQETGSFLDITFDDLDLDYFEENPRKSTASRSIQAEIPRPQSAMSQSSQYTTATNGNRKSTFHLFKNNRNSFSGPGDVVPPRASSPIPSGAVDAYDPDGGGGSLNFDDLIKSGGTVKVSLTPNRLRSIEIKDTTKKDELTPPTWERRSTSTSPRLSASRPSPLVRQNTTTSNNKRSNSALATYLTAEEEEEEQQQKHMSIEVPKISNMRSTTPSSPLGKMSFSVNEKTKFENPRDAPKPPTSTPLSPTISVTSTSSSSNISKNSTSRIILPPSILNKSPVVSPSNSITKSSLSTTLPLAPLPKSASSQVSYVGSTAANKAIPSTYSNDSISSEISSVPSIPSPITATPAPDTISNASTTTISIQEPPIPRPTKSIPSLNTNGMVIRRSSVSNKKSRDSLRSRVKEEQQQQQKNPDEPVPTKLMNTEISQQQQQQQQEEEEEEGNEEMKKEQEEEVLMFTDEPAPLDVASRQVHFDVDASSEGTPATIETITTTEEADQDTANNKPTEEEGTLSAVMPRMKKAATLSPERPSSMVAKRASMVGNNRRRSLHESFAAEKYHQDVLLRQRVSTVGSVSVSIKQWDDILKPEEQVNVIPPAAHRRSVLRQLRQQQLKEQKEQLEQLQEGGGEGGTGEVYLNGSNSNNNSNAVLDKVLKFERASSLDDVAHQRVSHMPRRERFLYLQQDPSAIERKSTVTTTTQKTVASALSRAAPNLLKRHVVGIDQGIQTEPEEVAVVKNSSSKKKSSQAEESEEEEGEVDGDEEWFLQDDEWDEQEETAIVEWLLGE